MQDTNKKYLRFLIMIATSMLVMLALMYLNTYEWSHIRWSETRFYMMLIMGAAMAIVMLAFMLGMYKNRTINGLILASSLALFVTVLWLVRSQETVQDESWMKAMIPHHSIAILTSERAEISDARVRELANAIIRAQRREIKEMEWLIKDIQDNGPATTPAQVAERPLPEFDASME